MVPVVYQGRLTSKGNHIGNRSKNPQDTFAGPHFLLYMELDLFVGSRISFSLRSQGATGFLCDTAHTQKYLRIYLDVVPAKWCTAAKSVICARGRKRPFSKMRMDSFTFVGDKLLQVSLSDPCRLDDIWGLGRFCLLRSGMHNPSWLV